MPQAAEVDAGTVFLPWLVARDMLCAGIHASVVESVRAALRQRPACESMIFWLRLQGRSYGEISDELDMNKGRVWKILHGPIRNCVYSVIERSTEIQRAVV